MIVVQACAMTKVLAWMMITVYARTMIAHDLEHCSDVVCTSFWHHLDLFWGVLTEYEATSLSLPLRGSSIAKASDQHNAGLTR